MDENRRRWFQFRLRTLLIATLVLSLPLSWFAVRMERARRQREAVEVIEQMGGRALYVCQAQTPLFGTEEPIGPSWLRELFGDDFFNDVAHVDLCDTEADDSALVHLHSFPKLRSLDLYGTRVTDAGLQQLAKFELLERLYLSKPLYRTDQLTADGLGQRGGVIEVHNISANSIY